MKFLKINRSPYGEIYININEIEKIEIEFPEDEEGEGHYIVMSNHGRIVHEGIIDVNNVDQFMKFNDFLNHPSLHIHEITH